MLKLSNFLYICFQKRKEVYECHRKSVEMLKLNLSKFNYPSFHSLYRPVSYKMNTVGFSVHSSSADFENFWLWVQTSWPAGAFVCAYVGLFQSAPSKHMHVKLIADFKLAAE